MSVSEAGALHEDACPGRPPNPGTTGLCSPETPPLSAFALLNKELQASSFLLCRRDVSSVLQKFPSHDRKGGRAVREGECTPHSKPAPV